MAKQQSNNGLLEGFVPAPEADAQQKYLAKLTKYSKLDVANPFGPGKGVNRVTLTDDGSTDVVAVLDESTGTAALVMRTHTGDEDLGGGKTFRVYEITAMRVFGRGEEGAQAAGEAIAQLAADHTAEIVAGIPGWANE